MACIDKLCLLCNFYSPPDRFQASRRLFHCLQFLQDDLLHYYDHYCPPAHLSLLGRRFSNFSLHRQIRGGNPVRVNGQIRVADKVEKKIVALRWHVPNPSHLPLLLFSLALLLCVWLHSSNAKLLFELNHLVCKQINGGNFVDISTHLRLLVWVQRDGQQKNGKIC